MYTEEMRNTVAKATLILLDIRSKENKNSYISNKMDVFGDALDEITDYELWVRLGAYKEDFNPLKNAIYLYESDCVVICESFKNARAAMLILPEIYFRLFFDILQKDFSELYDIVWTNWDNPKYNISFKWEKIGKDFWQENLFC